MVMAHAVGGALGGALSVLAVWLLMTPVRTLLPSRLHPVFVLLVFCAAILIDLKLIRGPRGRQVPQQWYRRFGGSRSYFFYGLALGTVLGTYVPYASAYVFFARASLTSGITQVLLAGATLGLARSLAVIAGVPAPRLVSKLLYRWRHSSAVWSKVSLANSFAIVAGPARAILGV
jgi:hypothetical protein